MAFRKLTKSPLLRFFIWLLFMFIITVPFIGIGIVYPNQITILSRIISQNQLIFTSLRWLMIFIVFVSWSRFIRYRAKHRYWKPEKTMFWLNQRLKITFWLILFELLICENLPLTLIHFLEGH